MADVDDARSAFLRLQHELRDRRAATSSATDDDALRMRTSAAFDIAIKSGVQFHADEVKVRLLRPPWSSSRLLPPPAAPSTVADARAKLTSRIREAGPLLLYLGRTDPLEAYRRLSEARHFAWAEAAIAATVSAVQCARARGFRTPRVLIAQGSLGAEAAAAAAAGGRVVVCEPNRFCASAIKAVVAAHHVAHAVEVVATDVEALLRRGGA